MFTQFLNLSLELTEPAELHRRILAELSRYGEPLRWAVVAVDSQAQTVTVEAVVTTASEFLLPDATPVTV